MTNQPEESFPDAPEHLGDLKRRYEALRFPDFEFRSPAEGEDKPKVKAATGGAGAAGRKRAAMLAGAGAGAAAGLAAFRSRFRRRPSQERRRAPEPPPPPPRNQKLYALKESIYSRRRLRPLLLLGALLLLLLATGIAWFLNHDFKLQEFAEETVVQMKNAPSYRAVGEDIRTSPSGTTEIRERFDFIAPDQVKDRFLTIDTQGQRGGFAGFGVVDATKCPDREVVVKSNTRWQKCNDPNFEIQGWFTDTFNPSVFDSTLFQPWERFAWCRDIEEAPDPQEINEVTTRVFSCDVPPELEAGLIFETAKDQPRNIVDRQTFIEQAEIHITAWVREMDGYIGRFVMKKRIPLKNGSEEVQDLDFVYTMFGEVPPIEPPSTAENVEGEVDDDAGTGSEEGAQGPDLPTPVIPTPPIGGIEGGGGTGSAGAGEAGSTGGLEEGSPSAGEGVASGTGDSGTGETGEDGGVTSGVAESEEDGSAPTATEAPLPTQAPTPPPVDLKAIESAETVTVAGNTFQVEVAADDASREKGLSLKTYLPKDKGMLFVFPSAERWIFWMKHTLIPLDVLLLDRSLTIVDIQTMEPEPGVLESELTRYQSSQAARFALEINGGLAAELGIEVGMRVQVE